MSNHPVSCSEYAFAIICALPQELAAATAMLDEVHPNLPTPHLSHITYILGRVGDHNVILTCLPAGGYGLAPATTVVSHLQSMFPNVRYGLMVGIGGGVPSDNADIRLGDVVVSRPNGTSSGVTQYDRGKAICGGHFQRTGTLNQPPTILLTAIAQLEAGEMNEKSDALSRCMFQALYRYPNMMAQFSKPLGKDRLFHAKYEHQGTDATCINCDAKKVVSRTVRTSEEPHVHYGTIASGNQVIKDGSVRDEIARQLDAICFEMEAAGIMNYLPCLVIRGICDYCDSHKNDDWQGYAALAAAAYAKVLLSLVPGTPKSPHEQRLSKEHKRVQIEDEVNSDVLQPRSSYIHNSVSGGGSTSDPTNPWSSGNPRPTVTQLNVLDYYRASSNCGKWCICKCHAPLRFRLSLLDGVLASIGITMSGSSSDKSLCTETTCSRRSVCVSTATIQLPAFILKKIIYLAVSVHPYGRLDMSFRALRIVPDNADIMQFAKKGSLDDVRSLFNKGLAAPTDVNDSWRVPVLSYAVQSLHLDLCRFLITEGAIPSVENRSNVSALDRAWDIFLSRSCDIETEQNLRSIFSLWYDTVWFEEQQFTSLHKIVLGAVDHDLKAQLELSTSNINEKDSKGRTPIAWAAARGDMESVKTLLLFGADPEISCDTGNNPLLRSVRAKSLECVRVLLKHGADVRRKSVLGFTALHYAAYYRNDEAFLRTLLSFGAQIDDKDNYGWTPLSCTAEYDQHKSAQVLLDYGADLNIPDNIGWTPILRAISSNSHRVLKLLIEQGADCCSLSSRLETVLHFAAARGDLKTIELLTTATMRGLNADIRDIDGHTAAELFFSRGQSSFDLVTAFTNLLDSVKNVSSSEGFS